MFLLRRETQANSNLDNMLNPEKFYDASSDTAQASKLYRDSFKALDINKAFQNMFKLLWYSTVIYASPAS